MRDCFMNRTPNDYDVASSCPPSVVYGLFPRCIETGLAFGTVTVLTATFPVEVTVFREESDYSDNRHPANVQATDSIFQDLSRRDFTINAMAWHPKRGLYDPFEGQKDMVNRSVKAVGDPLLRFREDALRILRCLRFASELDFDIEENTLAAALQCAHSLEHISVERISAEIRRLIVGSRPELLAELIHAGGLRHVGLHRMQIAEELKKIPPVLSQRLAGLLWLCHTETKVLEKLRFDKHTIADVSSYLYWLNRPLPADLMEMKRAFSSLPPSKWRDLLNLREILWNEDTQTVGRLFEEAEGQPWNRSMLAVSGKELKKFGFQGTEIGHVLNLLLEQVIRSPESNTKENLLITVQKLLEIEKGQ